MTAKLFCRIITVACIAMLLAGCPSKPVKTPVSVTNIEPAQRNFEQWIRLASQAPADKRASLYLNATQAAIRTQRFVDAQSALAEAKRHPMTSLDMMRWQLYQGILLTHQGDFNGALALFSKISPVGDDDIRLFHLWRARAYQLSGNYLEAARERIVLMSLLPEARKQDNADAIWYLLSQISPDYLALFAQSTDPNTPLYGWLQLATLRAQYKGRPVELLRALKTWQARFADHQANQWLPRELASIQKATLYAPKTIAILLPETGPLAPSATIIRKGIETAYLLERGARPRLLFFDSQTKDLKALHEQLLAQSVDFVIGPLDKARVAQWLALTTIPTLALNRVDEKISSAEHTYQFGLPIEDEARQIANRMRQNGFRHVATLVPDTGLGQRAFDSFRKQFLQDKDNRIVSQKIYIPGREYTNTVKSLLGIDQSEKRRKEVERWIGHEVEFIPRRRQDLEALFVHATPMEGRRIKPLLDYYFAFDLPIYSDSKIFGGKMNDRLDKDLLRVEFVDMPWLLQKHPAELSAILEQLKSIWPFAYSGGQGRLFAYGMDALRIIPQLGVLEAFPKQYFSGVVGRLYMDQNTLVREMPWAKFTKKGVQWIGYADELEGSTGQGLHP
ncbi:MAG: hypothetical protein D6694_10155 [Gammaproteobacteria bacterium]|nr:MAG: hypothetical protein D6694_10155 [Gammaproteobacteria bacterium]